MPALDALLVLGLWAVYLADAALLLHYDELAVDGRGGYWRIHVGGRQAWAGRYLHVPNPFVPMRGLFRASWLTHAPRAAGRRPPVELMIHLRGVGVGCAALGAVLLLGVPALLVVDRRPPVLLAGLGLAYLLILAMAAAVWRRRALLGLSSRQVLALGAECLLCPPCGINLVRKACLLHGFHADPLRFAARALPPADQARLRHGIEERLSLAEAYATPGSGTAAALADSRHRLGECLP